MTVTSPNGNEYTVGKELGRTDDFSLYACSLPEGGEGILKIVSRKGNNGLLDREARILTILWEGVSRAQEAVARLEPEQKSAGYDRMFPRLVESFVDQDQGGRRISVLDLTKVAEELGDIVPLGRLLSDERVRVDPKTSVWIMGKLLKLLHFGYMCGVSGAKIDGENILIDRERHNVLLFDWTTATAVPDKVESEIVREEISCAAKQTILALGGDPETGILPKDEQLTHDWYEKLLWSFAQRGDGNAEKAHRHFYDEVHKVWPGKFHPFTAHPVKGTTATVSRAVIDGEETD